MPFIDFLGKQRQQKCYQKTIAKMLLNQQGPVVIFFTLQAKVISIVLSTIIFGLRLGF